MRVHRLAGFVASVLAPTAGTSTDADSQQPKPSRYLYVWAGTGGPKTTGVNSLVVIDVDPASSKYGRVINAITVDTAGSAPHHTEFQLPQKGRFFLNDYGADRNYLVDFTDAPNPRLVARSIRRTSVVPFPSSKESSW